MIAELFNLDDECPKGTFADLSGGECNPITLGGPPLLVCDPPLVHRWNPDGSQACVQPEYLGGPGTNAPPCPAGTMLVGDTCVELAEYIGPPVPNPNPAVTTTNNPATTPTTGNGLIDLLPDGVVDANGNIFGFSPLMIGVAAVGVFFLMNSGKK